MDHPDPLKTVDGMSTPGGRGPPGRGVDLAGPVCPERPSLGGAGTVGDGEGDGCGPPGGRGAVGPLPCQDSNKCTLGRLAEDSDPSKTGSAWRAESVQAVLRGNGARTAFALQENVCAFARRVGVDRVGVLTLTTPDVVGPKELSRRWRSFRTHLMPDLFGEWITVVERSAAGRLHMHLLVDCQEDIRTGVDWEEVGRGVYRSCSESLRCRWKVLRARAEGFGFGRHELLPVRKDSEALGCYVGKYIQKHILWREPEDKGIHLVRYSEGTAMCSTRFAFNSEGSRRWRFAVGVVAAQCRFTDYSDFAEKFGARWAYHLGSYIIRIGNAAWVEAEGLGKIPHRPVRVGQSKCVLGHPGASDFAGVPENWGE